jgi:hypothetical protein
MEMMANIIVDIIMFLTGLSVGPLAGHSLTQGWEALVQVVRVAGLLGLNLNSDALLGFRKI